MIEMSWEVTKDGVSVRADTREELAIAIAVLTHVADEQPVPLAAAVNAPAWRVGGPPDVVPNEDDDPPVLTLLPQVPEPSATVAARFDGPQHIPVKAVLLDVLEAVLVFPEGVETRAIMTLLGLSDSAASNRIQRLKSQGLVERLPHKNQWRATTLARRAKLVRA